MKVYFIAIATVFSIAAKSTAFTVPPSIQTPPPSRAARNSNDFSSKDVSTTVTSPSSSSSSSSYLSTSWLFPQPRRKTLQHLTATALSPVDDSSPSSSMSKGLFTFKTKYGYLNPFAIYYGLTSILLGLPWFAVLTLCQIMYKITNNAWDKMRRFPIFFSHVWGVLLLRLTRSYPTVQGMDILDKFYKE